MGTHLAVCLPFDLAKVQTESGTCLEKLVDATVQQDSLEAAADYGRWWLDTQTSQVLLSYRAAHFLDVAAGLYPSSQSCAQHIVSDDIAAYLKAMTEMLSSGENINFQFRVIHERKGLRWLRMQSLPNDPTQPALRTGILVDITSAKIAAMREHFSYEVTQSLVGQDNLTKAVNKVLQLVCKNLGWDWGAYWTLDPRQTTPPVLTCQHYWNFSNPALASFTTESCEIQFSPGEGFVGHTWSTGIAAWAEESTIDENFLRRESMLESGLQSGYIFPVSYIAEDGRQHRVGVLEFFSCLPRQCEAQLPGLSIAIGSLIAQTVLRMEQQERIRRMAQTDDLTGLANRAHFHYLVNAMCTHAQRTNKSFGLLYIDLDRFKPINDTFGHDAGNAVLREFSRRLLAVMSEGGHAGRLGGDEFAVLAPTDIGTELQQLQALIDDIMLAATTPFEFEGHQMSVSASIGMGIYGINGDTSQELLRNADAAMYRCKRGKQSTQQPGGQPPPSFLPGNASLEEEAAMENRLHHALLNEEFYLEYQPIFDNFSRQMIAVEALMRWRLPSGEIVPPDVFIPIAEKSQLIMQIGRWVIKQACLDLEKLHCAGYDNLEVSVNMAAMEFTNTDLPADLKNVVDSSGVRAHHVCLELTEGMVMKHPEKVIPVMKSLRQLGFSISLDDFGIGHSSLSRIKTLPITSLKIDRSFIRGLPHDRGDGAIVRTILDLGRHLNLTILAEGVETDAQLGYLTQFGCPLIQGYFLSLPLPINKLLEMRSVG